MGKESRLRRPSFLIVFGEADPPALSDFQGFTKDVFGRNEEPVISSGI